jgi:hypothetical protein
VAKEQVKFQIKLNTIQEQLKKSENAMTLKFIEMLQEQRNSLLAEIACQVEQIKLTQNPKP